MNRYLLAALAALAVLLAPGAQAQITPTRLDALFGSEPRVEVNLRGSLLRLAAAATRDDDPDAALMLDGLRAVTVRIYSAADASRPQILSSMTDLGREFEREGWMTMVRVRSLPNDDENDGDVWVYVLDDGDNFGGLAVMAMDEEDHDAVFVHIDGTIRPEDVARLTSKFGDIDIDIDGSGDNHDYDADDE